MNEAPPPFDFAALDGLAFAFARGRDPMQGGIRYEARPLGPILEWVMLAATGLMPPPAEVGWLRTGPAGPLIAALSDGRRQWICPATRACGFFRTPAVWPEDDTAWTGFGLAAQKAATAAGFHRTIAARFLGAAGELMGNIHEHSQAASTGVVAFRASGDGFEFVVADGGIGVLESLQSCVDYKSLSDHGAALRRALTDGVSRFGPSAGRGHGFRPIFVGLANLSGLLRFRSGDHALVIDGQAIDVMAAKTAQKVPMRGFTASVSCRLPTARQGSTA